MTTTLAPRTPRQIQSERARDTISNVIKRPEFRERDNTEPAMEAFSRIAFSLAALETGADGSKSNEAYHLSIAASVHDYVDGNLDLFEIEQATKTDNLDGERVRLTPEQVEKRDGALDKIIPFNHTVKEYISNDKGAKFTDIVEYVVAFYAMSHSAHLKTLTDGGQGLLRFVRERTRECINGMRHEKGVVEMLRGTYEVNASVSIQDDKKGCDMRVTTLDGHWNLPADAKASDLKARKARAERPNRKNAIIWSTLSDEDFEADGFTLAPETVARHRPRLFKELEAEIEHLTR